MIGVMSMRKCGQGKDLNFKQPEMILLERRVNREDENCVLIQRRWLMMEG
jgi:hypothetical protein